MQEDRIEPEDLAGIYRDIAEVIGVESTMKLHAVFQGQQITMPKKLYTLEYIVSHIEQTEKVSNIKVVASKFGYTERRLRQIIKENQY